MQEIEGTCSVLFICLSKCLTVMHYLSYLLPYCCFGFYFDFWVFQVMGK